MTGVFQIGAHAAFAPTQPAWHTTQGIVLRVLVPLLAVVVYAFIGGLLFYFVDSTGVAEDAPAGGPALVARTAVQKCQTIYANQSQTLAHKMSDTRLVISGSAADERLRHELLSTARSLASNATVVCGQERLENQFMTLLEAVFFCWTIYTTIGYGVLSPATWPGKLFVIIYAVIGIPLAAYVLLITGDMQFQMLWWLYMQFQRRILRKKRRKLAKMHPAQFPFSFALLSFVLWWLLSALWFCLLEGWTYLDSIYMVFCSLTKIGLGDFTPTSAVPLSQITAMFCILSGMVLVSMTFSLAIIKRNRLSDIIHDEIMKGAHSTMQLKEKEVYSPRPATHATTVTASDVHMNGHVPNGVVHRDHDDHGEGVPNGDVVTKEKRDIEKQLTPLPEPAQPPPRLPGKHKPPEKLQYDLNTAMKEVERLYLVDAGVMSKLVNNSQRKFLAKQMMRVARMRHVQTQIDAPDLCDRGVQTQPPRQFNTLIQTDNRQTTETKVVVRRPVERSYPADLRFFPKADQPFSLIG